MNEISFIQDQIGYQFKNPALLTQAFTRRSYSAENGGQDNEVLEFIGDKVLDLVVVKLLAESYGRFGESRPNPMRLGKTEETEPFISDMDEGKLTELKKQLVQKKTLAEAIDNLGLESFLRMGRGDVENEVQNTASVKEDLFEAILGAIALDSGWDMAALQDTVSIMLKPDEVLKSDEVNYVSEIQEWSLRHAGTIPFHHFEHWSRQATWFVPQDPRCIYGETPEDTHFACELQLSDVEHHFVGYGKSKNLARIAASRLAYEYLEENDLLMSIRDEIENPNKDEAISQLEILSRRGHFPLPEYVFQETHDNDGNPIWDCECSIEGVDHVTSAKSSSKKDVKKQVAFEMLQYVLEEL